MGAPKGHPPYNVNGEGGVPKIYTDEFIEKEAVALEEWMKQPGSIYFKRFSFDRGYSYKRLGEFAKSNKRFADTFERAKEWQEIRLAEGGLTEEFNGGFCKFVMGNACGWSEKNETKISGDATNPLSFIVSDISGNSRDFVSDSESK